MALNVILVAATVVVSYVLGHFIALRQARRQNLAPPAFFDYGAHRALWSQGIGGYRRDPRFWAVLVIAIVIVDLLTHGASFGIGFAIAAAAGFVAGGVYRAIRARDGEPS